MSKCAPQGKMVILWIFGCLILPPLALVWFGLWLVDRSNKERKGREQAGV